MFTYLKNFMGLAWKVKKFEFWRARLGGKLPLLNPQFVLGVVYF